MDELNNDSIKYLAFEDDLPTKTSDLTNDRGYVTKTEMDANIPFKFGIDANGKYGYIKAGADTVTPFKDPSGTKTIRENGIYDISDYASADVSVEGSSSTVHTETYVPLANKSDNDMGETHNYRYVNTDGMYQTSGTKSIDSNGTYDVNQYQTAQVSVSTDTMHTRTYTPEPDKSNNDMGLIHTYRYVNTSGMVVPSGTKSITSNGEQDISQYQKVNVNVPATVHTETYTPQANKSDNDMGSSHNYKYVNTLGMYVPSGTKSITSNGTYDVSQYESANVNVESFQSVTTGELWLAALKETYESEVSNGVSYPRSLTLAAFTYLIHPNSSIVNRYMGVELGSYNFSNIKNIQLKCRLSSGLSSSQVRIYMVIGSQIVFDYDHVSSIDSTTIHTVVLTSEVKQSGVVPVRLRCSTTKSDTDSLGITEKDILVNVCIVDYETD